MDQLQRLWGNQTQSRLKINLDVVIGLGEIGNMGRGIKTMKFLKPRPIFIANTMVAYM